MAPTLSESVTNGKSVDRTSCGNITKTPFLNGPWCRAGALSRVGCHVVYRASNLRKTVRVPSVT